MEPRKLAIVRSVLYAALFEYPLTLAQLRRTVEVPLTPSRILAAYERSAELQAIVEHREGFFFPRGRGEFVSKRHQREARSRAFLRRNRLLLACICAMPYVRMVALSGSMLQRSAEDIKATEEMTRHRRHGPAEPRRSPRSRGAGSGCPGPLTEGPRWEAERAELLRVDILAGELHTATVGDDGQLEAVRTRRWAGMSARPCGPRPVATCSPPWTGLWHRRR